MGGFLMSAQFVHKAQDKFQMLGSPTSLIAISLLFQSLSAWLIGPSDLLGHILPDRLPTIITGLLLAGLSGSFTQIGSYSEMHDSFFDSNPGCDADKLSDVLAGLFNSAISLGTLIGPILASYITILAKSFRVCSDVFAVLTFGFLTALTLVVIYP
jgi:hypothetical protein